jgi:hypothetical protein
MTGQNLARALATVDAWQKAATNSIRQRGYVEAEYEASLAHAHLPEDLWERTLLRIADARTTQQVSDVFAPLRKGFRDAERLMKQAEVTPLAGDLQDDLLALYAERRQRIAIEAQRLASADGAAVEEFETEAG